MAPSGPDHDMLTVPRTYTLTEALDYEEAMDRFPTQEQIHWVNARTGQPVIIGRSGGTSTLAQPGKLKKDKRHTFTKNDKQQNKYRSRNHRP